MNLIDCPACGNQVSEQAHQCPACGHPIADNPKNKTSIPNNIPAMFKKSKIPIIVVSVTLIVILGIIGLFSDKEDTETTTEITTIEMTTVETTTIAVETTVESTLRINDHTEVLANLNEIMGEIGTFSYENKNFFFYQLNQILLSL